MRLLLTVHEGALLRTTDGTVVGQIESVAIDVDIDEIAAICGLSGGSAEARPRARGRVRARNSALNVCSTTNGGGNTDELQSHIDEIKTPPPSEAQTALLPSPMSEVWNHYQATIRGASRRSFDPTRQTCIRRALRARTVDECIKAIDGLAASRWHNGDNPERKRYLDIQYALGRKTESPDERIDKMIALLSDDRPATSDVLARFSEETQESIYRMVNLISRSIANPDAEGLRDSAETYYRDLARVGLRPTFDGVRLVGWETIEP